MMTTSSNVYSYLKWLYSADKNIPFACGIENWFGQTVEAGTADT